jgi:hypothetical protein
MYLAKVILLLQGESGGRLTIQTWHCKDFNKYLLKVGQYILLFATFCKSNC